MLILYLQRGVAEFSLYTVKRSYSESMKGESDGTQSRLNPWKHNFLAYFLDTETLDIIH